MANELTQLQQIGFEIEAAFDTRNAAPTFPNIQVMDLTYQPRRTALADDTWRGQRGTNPIILGPMAGSEASGAIYNVGLQTAAGDGVTATATAHGPLWQIAVGAETLTTGTTVTGGTAGVPIVTRQGSGNDIEAGTIAGFTVVVGSSTFVAWRLVLSVADSGGDDALTLDRELPAAPSGVVYGSATYAWGDNGPGDTAQARVVTQTTDSDWEFYGMACNSWAIDAITTGEVMRSTHNWLMASYTDDPSTIGAVSPGPVTLTGKNPWMDAQVSVWDYDTSTVTYSAAHDRCLRTLTAEHNLDARIAPCPNDTEGISGWEFGDGSLADITWSVNRVDDWRDAYITGMTSTPSYYGQMITSGRVPGRVWGVYYRRTNLNDNPQLSDDNGQMTTTVTSSIDSNYSAGLAPFYVFQA